MTVASRRVSTAAEEWWVWGSVLLDSQTYHREKHLIVSQVIGDSSKDGTTREQSKLYLGTRVIQTPYPPLPPLFRTHLVCSAAAPDDRPLLHRASTSDSVGRIRSCAERTWEFLKSKRARMVLKCSLAYFFGSLATYVCPSLCGTRMED